MPPTSNPSETTLSDSYKNGSHSAQEDEDEPAVDDCSDCVGPVDTEQDTYCEDRPNQDCGAIGNWFDDDYKWQRNVNIYSCPEGQFRKCANWARNGCCPVGAQGQPPADCGTKNGRADCESRI